MKMKIKINKEVILRALFSLTLAVFLWAIASVDDNPSITSRYNNIPIEYINLDEDFTVDSIQSSVDIKLSGSNIQMTQVRRNDLKAIVDLSEITTEGSYTIEVTITGIPDNVAVSDISERYVMVVVGRITSSEYEVVIETQNNVPNDHILLNMDYDTDSVTAIGSENKTSEISTIKGYLDLSNLTTDFSIEVKLQPYDSLGNLIDDVIIQPSAITVSGEIGIIKTVNVTPSFTGECSSGYRVKTHSTDPVTVTIGGKPSVINNISEVLTENVSLSGKSASFKQTVKLLTSKDYILVSNTNVNLSVEIIGYSTKILNINTLQVRNQANTLNVDKSAFTGIQITVTGFEDELESVTESNINLFIDLEGLGEGTHTVELQVVAPDNISIESMSTKTVDIVITAN